MDYLTLISKGNSSVALVSAEEAVTIVSYDSPFTAKAESQKHADYIRENSTTCYIKVNVWLFLIDAHSRRSSVQLKSYMLQKGLLQAIKGCEQLADALVHSGSVANCELYPIMSDLISQVGTGQETDLQALNTVLECLRFPKRYSPVDQQDSMTAGLNKFIDLNKSIRTFATERYMAISPLGQYYNAYQPKDVYDTSGKKLFVKKWQPISWKEAFTDKMVALFQQGYQDVHVTSDVTPAERAEYPYINLYRESYLYYDVKREVQKIIKGTPLADNHYSYTSDMIAENAYFSTGATAELSGNDNTLLEKLKALRNAVPYYLHPLYGWSKRNRKLTTWDSCVVKAVEKSYKTPRIIAKEPVWRNFICSAIREETIHQLMEKHPKIWESITTKDQTMNRDACWEGSAYDKYATCDLSSASDSIPAWMGCDLFPIFAHNPELRSGYMEVDGEVYHNNIFLTSGHALTFLCEAIVFYAIAKVATEYTRVFYCGCEAPCFALMRGPVEALPSRVRFKQPRVFGDDVLIDTKVYDMYVSLMETLGFTVNEEKSFTSPSPYRESCGEEYMYGYPMHGCKWPRTTYRWARQHIATNVASLVALQHSLYYRDWRISVFLSEVCRRLVPTLTSSGEQVECADLWNAVPVCKQSSAPYDKRKKKPSEWSAGINPDTGKPYHFVIPAPLPEEIPTRELHSTLVSEYPIPNGKGNLTTDEVLELYLYVEFLKKGPTYDSKLDELLNVSSKVDRSALVARAVNVWRLVVR